MPRSFLVVLMLLALAPAALGQAKAPAGPAPGAADLPEALQGELKPGKEVKIEDPATGGLGYWVLYVPSDYSDDRDWPLIVCLDGLNQNPQTSPFKNATGGKGFLIVGFEYLDRTLSPKSPVPGKSYNQAEVDNLRRVLGLVGRKVKVNPKLLFLGGFSQGGWRTNDIGHATIDMWAGLVIIGAGGGSARDKALVGKPIFIGVGEKCGNNDAAKRAVESYKTAGAVVTFEEWKGLGHAYNDKCPVLKQWLLDNGPLKQVKLDFAAAKDAEKAGRLGTAYRLYYGVSKSASADGPAAEQALRTIADKAQKELADAQALVAQKKLGPAVAALNKVASVYEGAPFAVTAKQEAERIRTDPTLKAEAEQAELNLRAAALETRAKAADDAKDYATAIALYQQYCTQFAKADHYAAVKARLDALKADPAITAAITKEKADRDCRGWLSMADSYLAAGRKDLAQPLLDKIIATYPDSDWAAKAKARGGK